MAVTSKPDTHEYLTRLTEIEMALVSGSIAASNPRQTSSLTMPYWINTITGRRSQRETAFQKLITFTAEMILVVSTTGGGVDFYSEEKVSIYLDDVEFGFELNDDYRNLITTTYTSIQAGFVPTSAVITVARRAEMPNEKEGVNLCSYFNLQWQHRMKNTA